MSGSVDTIIQVIAYGVPALMIMGGILLLLIGYPLNHSQMIVGGWVLIFSGAVIYVFELALKHDSR